MLSIQATACPLFLEELGLNSHSKVMGLVPGTFSSMKVQERLFGRFFFISFGPSYIAKVAQQAPDGTFT
jgi:hypothetical protein